MKTFFEMGYDAYYSVNNATPEGLDEEALLQYQAGWLAADRRERNRMDAFYDSLGE